MMKQTTFLLFIFLIVLTMTSCQQKASKDIGIQLYSVRDDMKNDPAGTIAKLGAMGFTFVEAADYSDGLFYGMTPAGFNKLLEANGMVFLSSHKGHNLPDSTNWDKTMAWWSKCIDDHAAAGVKYIVQPSMDQKGYGSLEDLKRYCDYFNAIGEMCNAKGIRFGYHNHMHEFEVVDGETRYDYMLQNTDPKKVMFQMDLYWIQKGGKSALEYFEKYPGRFELWHVKDETELGGEDGVMDFKPIFGAAKQAGMQHIIIEVERYNYSPIESVQKSLEFLQAADYVN